MTKRVSIDEIVSKRRASASDDGKLFKAVILDDAEQKAGYDPDKRAQRFIMTTERVDLYGDIVRQDGINLDDFLKNPVGLAYHNHGAPIGWWKDVTKINGRPKRTEGVLALHPSGTTASVDEIDRLLAASAIKACSIGFMPLDAEWIVDAEGRNTWGLDFIASSMLECSVCSVPANPDALAKAAGGDTRLAAELFERFLDTYCEKTAGGVVVRKEFADAYMAMKAPKTIVDLPKVEDDKTSIKITLNLDEAERQAESFVEKWSKKVAGMFSVPAATVEHVQSIKYVERDHIALKSIADVSQPGIIEGDWPAKATIDDRAFTDSPWVKRDGKVITIETSNKGVAEYHIAGEPKDGEFPIDFVRSCDRPPAIVAGSRQKAVVASARLKQSLRERNLLT